MKPAAMIAQVAFIGVAAFGVYSFVGAAQRDMKRSSCAALCKLAPAYAGADRTAPDFELPDLDGKPVRLSSFRGKVVFLNFWTRTCNPCLEEMQSIADLAKIGHGRSDFVVLTVSTDEAADARDALKVALKGEAPPFPVLLDPESNIVNDKYGTHLFPETWIIDPDGVIRARIDGAKDWGTALAVEVGAAMAKPGSCPIEFAKGQPRGQYAGLCADDS